MEDRGGVTPNVCGLLFCYNEERVLARNLEHYLDQGIDLVVFDNESSDRSPEILRGFAGQPEKFPGKILEIVPVRTQGFEWRKILSQACVYMHEKLGHYPWIMTIDADAFYESPVRGKSLNEFIELVGRFETYNIIDGRLFDFWPSDRDDPAETDFRRRMRFCRIHEPSPQQKIFRYHPEIDFFSRAGHLCLRPDPRIAPLRFLYCHYKWTSYEHGLIKVFGDRIPRYVEQKSDAGLFEHPQYRGLLPIRSDLVKSSESLTRFELEKHQRSPGAAQARLRLFHRNSIHKKYLRIVDSARRGILAKLAGDLKDWLQILSHEPYRGCGALLRKIRGPSSAPSHPKNPISALSTVTFEDLKLQKITSRGLPLSYHFLLTDFCNAACIFCNQDFAKGFNRQITLEMFEKMTGNIPLDTKGADQISFTFSGGGDPLLASDLLPILSHCKDRYPWVKTLIRTNGLKLADLGPALVEAGLGRLEISVHGASHESNDKILQRHGGPDLFEAIDRVSRARSERADPMYISLCPVVSLLNIGELVPILHRAAELRLDEVNVSFSRIFPWEDYQSRSLKTARAEDSLYFHQDRYNSTIQEARQVAERLGLNFVHEPMFGEKFQETHCAQPWCTMLIDHEGDVFPCTGGEVWFKEKVKSGAYRFGNLLQERVSEMILNESYIRLKRTVHRDGRESFIPECTNCHNTACFKGPNVEAAHILKKAGSPCP